MFKDDQYIGRLVAYISVAKIISDRFLCFKTEISVTKGKAYSCVNDIF